MIRILSIFFLIASVAAQQKPADVQRENTGEKLPPEQYHFLFVLDTSLSMAPRKAVAIRMVSELIASGFVGQARNGDSIDIWLYDQENDISRFPPQIWDDTEGKRIADAAAGFIEKLEFKGRSRFAPVARDLDALLPNTKHLLVVLLTDGEEPLSGIAPDIEINEYVGKLKRAIPPTHPIHISIAAVGGRFDRWAVYNGDGKDDLASLPPRAQPKPLVAKVTPPTPKEAKPKEKKEKKAEEKKPEERPIAWELPPGARLANPTPAPKTPQPQAQAPIARSTPAPKEQTNSAALLAKEAKPTNQTTVALSSEISTEPKVSASPNTTTPGVAKPVVPPTAQTPTPAVPVAVSASPATSSAISNSPAQLTSANVAQKNQTIAAPVTTPSATNSAKPQSPISSVPLPVATKGPATNQPAESTNVVLAARITPVDPPASSAPRPGLAASPIVTAALFGGLGLAGFAIIAIGAILFLKRAKARHDGSIISQSLLR